MFSILEVGVDGVIFSTSSINEVKEAMVYLGTRSFEMKQAKIIEIKEVGDGERVCVDTASILHKGEGMLIGNRSNFLFLVHNESVGSSFTSPRPFRVNAGAVHCYQQTHSGVWRSARALQGYDRRHADLLSIRGHDGGSRRWLQCTARKHPGPTVRRH